MRISVVIPVRNDAVPLAACLAALSGQSRPADEVVVVDNASSDDSAAVAQAAGARVVVESVVGIPRASAAGYDAATGDVVARLDADSLPGRDWLERVEARFEAEPELSLLTGTGRFYGATPLVHALGERLYLGGMFAAMTPYLGHPPVFGSNFAMRAEVWRRLGGEVHRDLPRVHDDLDLSFHVAPDMVVRLDRDLVVGVSARPFASLRGLARRVSWVGPTLAAHWPADAPWRRRATRRRARTGAQSTRA